MINLNKVDELQKKISSLRPLEKEEVNQLKEYYRIGLTYSSNALEGNTLTEVETKIVLEDGITIGGKPVRDHLEAIGHSYAFDFMYEIATKKRIEESDILELHRLFFNRIDESQAGHYRTQKIFVTGSQYQFPVPNAISSLMKTFVDTISDREKDLHPVLFSAYLHKEFVTIHPFIDGNGRSARLLMNLALVRHGYPIAIIPPILRKNYIESVSASNFGDDKEFNQLIIDRVYEAQKDYLRLLNL